MTMTAEIISATSTSVEVNGQSWHHKFATGILASPKSFAMPLEKKVLVFPTGEDLAGLRPGPDWKGQVRKFVPAGTTSMAGVTALRETSFTSGAAPVAHGALKPQSDWTGEQVHCPVVTIAHWVRVSKQLLDDLPAFEGMLQSRLGYMLAVAEDKELIQGNGTAPHLTGLLQLAIVTPGITPPVTAANLADNVGKALDALLTAGYMANGIILNPMDWSAAVRQAGPATGFPFLQRAEPSLWNVPVGVTPAMPAGQFLVGDFQSAAQIFDREDATMLTATQDRDNFVKDLLTIRAEERLALAVYQPGALRKAT